MKCLNLLIFIFVLLFYSISEIYAQYIIAGEVSANDFYKDIEPDLYFYAVATHHGPPTTLYEIDVDFDGIYDFRIKSYGDGGLMAGSGACTITGLHSAAFVVGFTDTLNNIPSLVDTINFGDTICASNLYISFARFWSASYGPVYSGASISHWKNTEHYIGFKLTYPNDTLYGWIRAQEMSMASNSTQFYVKDFACNIRTLANKTNGIVYPTLFRDVLNLLVPNLDESEILIIDAYGHILYQKKFFYVLKINTENLAHGMYYYKLTNAGKTINKGKIVKY